MSVVGYDFGNLNCYIAVARQGGIDVLTNDYSLHATPTCVSFGTKHRVMGVAARQQVNTNFKNTIINFKHLIGRKFSDPVTQLYKKFVPCELIQLSDDNIGMKVTFLEQTRVFTPEQILGAFLVKMKHITEGALGSKVNECVISVPFYFSDTQRRAVLAAGKIAGINLLKIVNETTAVGVAYGIYKGSSFPPEKDTPKLVAFVDVGHSSVQAALMGFNDRKVSVLGATHDLTVGGLFFDEMIREHFHREFLDKFGIDASKNPRAWLRLLDESEKLKKQMSANVTAIPFSIECFMDDKDVSGRMQRSQFEELCEPLFEKIRLLLRRLIEQSGVRIEDIAEVELIGGSSRIPLVRQLVAHFFNREPKTTMNQDEAVARGAGMQCAIISPSFKVKEFHIRDSYLFDIKIRYEGVNGQQDQVIFKRHDEFPFSKVLTLEKSSDFSVEAYYSNPSELPYPNSFIGSWAVKNVTPDPNGGPRKIRVKIRINNNGIFLIPSASAIELHPADDHGDEPMADATEVNGTATNGSSDSAGKEQQQIMSDESASSSGKDGDAKTSTEKTEKKPKKVVIDFVVEESVPYALNVEECCIVEREMQKIDLNEKLKADSKNAVEEYCYGMRDKLGDSLAAFVTEQEIQYFQSLLVETEEWLYDEGENAERHVYEQKLDHLRMTIESPIRSRQRDMEEKERAADEAAAGQAADAGGGSKQEKMDVDPSTAV